MDANCLKNRMLKPMNERPYRGSRSLQEPRCTSLLAMASQGGHIKQHRPFFGENLKGFEPQPDARKNQEN